MVGAYGNVREAPSTDRKTKAQGNAETLGVQLTQSGSDPDEDLGTALCSILGTG